MSLPTFTMRQLLEAGVHFGHHTRRWNPKMQPFLFGVRNGIHIIDLEQTVPMLHRALEAVRQVVSSGGRVLFVGTKRQAADLIFIIDTNKESIAVQEATKLGIPVVAVIDSNSDPAGVTYPIPGNDDALRAITMYCDLVSSAVLDGLQAEMVAAGVDIGESEEASEGAPAEAPAEGEQPQAEATA